MGGEAPEAGHYFRYVYKEVREEIPALSKDISDVLTLLGKAIYPGGPGVVYRHHDTKQDKKYILINTRFGTVVLYEHFGGGKSEYIGVRWPEKFPRSVVELIDDRGQDQCITQETLERIINSSNIGNWIENAIQEFEL